MPIEGSSRDPRQRPRNLGDVPAEQWVSYETAARQLGFPGRTWLFMIDTNQMGTARHPVTGEIGVSRAQLELHRQRLERGGTRLLLRRMFHALLNGI